MKNIKNFYNAKVTEKTFDFLFRILYDRADEYLSQESIAGMILILADYQNRAAFVNDAEINIMAALVELMTSCKFIG